jgi:hypothetical protein
MLKAKVAVRASGQLLRAQPGILAGGGERHTLSDPVTHGARVRLPEAGEGDLFEQ